MTDIEEHEVFHVFVGVDVGKGAHHAVALDRRGKRLLDSALPNDETKLRALIGYEPRIALDEIIQRVIDHTRGR